MFHSCKEAGFSFISCVILLVLITKDALPKFALFPSAANEFSLLQCGTAELDVLCLFKYLQVHAWK